MSDKTLYRQVSTKERNPQRWGWYDTDKGNLFWYEMETAWSCSEDKLSEEYPRLWYEKVEVPDDETATEMLGGLTPQSKGFYIEQRLFGYRWLRNLIFNK